MMDDKERTRLILQHVMGCFVLEETATGWRTPNFARGKSAPEGFHWPIAFWNTDAECWMMRDIATDPDSFDPLNDWNDAWTVIQRVYSKERTRLFLALEETIGDDWDDILDGMTPETLCLAALKAYGVEK